MVSFKFSMREMRFAILMYSFADSTIKRSTLDGFGGSLVIDRKLDAKTLFEAAFFDIFI